jgi:hypothetical protein
MVTRVAMFLLVVSFATGVLAGCGGEDRAVVAGEVAEQWAIEQVEEAVELVVELVMGTPAVSEALDSVPSLLVGTAESTLRDIIVEQVGKRLAWTTKTVSQTQGDIYRVTSEASVDIEAELPVVGTYSFIVTLPFRININVKEREVVNWTADLSSADVAVAGGTN